MDIKSAEFLKSAVDENSWPEDYYTEFMFCGRSNVGKSSFINMLVNRKNLARTSSNPGKTQTLNFFFINNQFYFVDVPGYGFAKVSKAVKATFGKMIEKYVKNRNNLKMVFLLVDFRHKPTEDDKLMYDFLKYHNLNVTIIATKSDKVKNSERAKCKDTIKETLGLDSSDRFIVTSSEKREGLPQTLKLLDDFVEIKEPKIEEITDNN